MHLNPAARAKSRNAPKSPRMVAKRYAFAGSVESAAAYSCLLALWEPRHQAKAADPGALGCRPIERNDARLSRSCMGMVARPCDIGHAYARRRRLSRLRVSRYRRYDDFGWRDVHIWGCVMKAIGMCGQSATFLCDFAHACANRNRDWLEWREWSIAIFLTKRVTPHRCRRLVLRFAEATFRALTGVLVCSPRYHAVLTTNRRSFVKNHQ